MLAQIITNTPLWVWGLAIGLIALGSLQLFQRTVNLRRIMLPSLAMAGFSLYGTLSAFGSRPQIMLAWLAAACLIAWPLMRRPLPDSTRYFPDTRQFALPGSWIPLALIMAIFSCKYAVGATLAMHPEWAGRADFSLSLGILYGAFSGAFIGRAFRLWRAASAGDHAYRQSLI